MNLHIIVPLYGRMEYFKECVASMEAALTPNTTVIVYHDGPYDAAARDYCRRKEGFLMFFGPHVGIAKNVARGIEKSLEIDPGAARVLLASDHRVPAGFAAAIEKVVEHVGDQAEIGHIHHTPGSAEFQNEWVKGSVNLGGVQVALNKSLSYLCSMPSLILGEQPARELAKGVLSVYEVSDIPAVNISRLFLSYWGMRTTTTGKSPFAVTGVSVEHMGNAKHPEHVRSPEHHDYYTKMKRKGGPVGPLSPHYYDQLFVTGGSQQAYHKPVAGNLYEKVWKAVANNVMSGTDLKTVLEMGCGSGALAEELLARGVRYMGVDFSPVAIALAKKRCEMFGSAGHFFVGDVHLPVYYNWEYTDFVATEVFEHVENDLRIASLIRSGTRIHLSLPNFFTKSHIRIYKDEEFIRSRFKSLFKFNSIVPEKRTVDVGSNRVVWICSGVRL